MGWFERLMFGVVFPFVFCSIGGFFARQGYLHFKTKKEKKLRCLSQTEGKIVSIHSMRMQRRQAYFPTYEYGASIKIGPGKMGKDILNKTGKGGILDIVTGCPGSDKTREEVIERWAAKEK